MVAVVVALLAAMLNGGRSALSLAFRAPKTGESEKREGVVAGAAVVRPSTLVASAAAEDEGVAACA